MTRDDISSLGFTELSKTPSTFSKLVTTSQLPPFYIRVEPAAYNDTDWRVLKDEVLITVVQSPQQLRQAIWVLTMFERDSFVEQMTFGGDPGDFLGCTKPGR